MFKETKIEYLNLINQQIQIKVYKFNLFKIHLVNFWII